MINIKKIYSVIQANENLAFILQQYHVTKTFICLSKKEIVFTYSYLFLTGKNECSKNLTRNEK